MLTKEDINRLGVTDLTDTEFEANKKFAPRVALNRILNMRKGIHLTPDRELVKAIVLGGRDFVYKGIKLEQAQSQFITVLVNTEDGPKFDEVTNWGHHKEANNGDGCDIEYEKKETTLDDGSTRTNKTIKKTIVKKEKAIQSYDDIKKSGILVKTPEQIDEDNLYEVVAVEGVITNVDEMPIWGNPVDGAPSVREGACPTWFNEQPCIRLALKSENANRIYINLNPTKMSKLMISWPEDFTEICKMNNIQEALATFVNIKVLAIGCVRKFKTQNEGNLINLDATALFTSDEWGPATAPIQAKIDATAPTTAPAKTPGRKPKKKDETPAPAPAAPTATTPAPQTPAAPAAAPKPAVPLSTGAMTVVETYKAAVASLMDVLGTEITVEDIRNAKVLPETCGEALVKALINKVKTERGS